MHARVAVASIAFVVVLLSLGCGRSQNPNEIARRNFLNSFGQMSSVLRAWNCDGPVTQNGDSAVVQCEYYLKGGYVTKMQKTCSTAPNGSCY